MTQSIIETFTTFSEQLLIVMTTFNRKDMTALCLANIYAYKNNAVLWVVDDYSTEYDLRFLRALAPTAMVFQPPHKMGIERLRLFIHTQALQQGYNYIYHIDNDVYHDPTWLHQLFILHQHSSSAKMISLYNSELHEPYTINTYDDALERTVCQGLSMFYKLMDMPSIDLQHGYNNWDIYFGKLLRPTLVSKMSYLEHFGASGLHNTDYETDRAVAPTPWLQVERSRILALLGVDSTIKPPVARKIKLVFGTPK